jgi:hypothetical protein
MKINGTYFSNLHGVRISGVTTAFPEKKYIIILYMNFYTEKIGLTYLPKKITMPIILKMF